MSKNLRHFNAERFTVIINLMNTIGMIPLAMEESKAKVGINPEFLPFLKGKNVNSVDEDVDLSLAIYLFTARKLTLARAAELCGKSLSDFIQILMDHNIHWAEYTEEQKRQDGETIGFILREDGKQDEGNM